MSSPHMDTGERHRLLAAILLLAATLRFWRLGDAALIGDESYYWLWSERLAPSYYDHPAGVALMVRLSTLIGGQSEAGIRWLNALLGVASVFLVYRIGTHLFSDPAALFAAALVSVGAPYLVVSRFVYTDALQLALMLINILVLLPFLPPEGSESPSSIPTRRFWAAALSTAALLNTKYNAYPYALAMATFLAVRRPGLLRDRRTWWAAGVAVLGLLPTMAWNAAHGWASYRWQLVHLAQQTLYRSTHVGRAWHAVRYLTFPLAFVSLFGATQLRGARRQMLYVPALTLVLPILLGPVDSPRNLINGVVLLILLGSDALYRWVTGLHQPDLIPIDLHLPRLASSAFMLLIFLWSGIYGVGTVLGTFRATAWPRSPVAGAIRQDGVGWRHVPDLDIAPNTLVFAVDYGIASQLRYYTGLPVQTAWGQYRLWGIPELERPREATETTVVFALPFVEPAIISERLEKAFSETVGPTSMLLQEGDESKQLNVWRARGRQVDAETFLQMLDLFDLAGSSQAAYREQAKSP